ncbi:hypothetical protein I4U23_014047 [Adineta vaga]|nr:hypothetical protein I4U23_014047 [Adineta vaga]
MDSESKDTLTGKILGLFQRLIYDIVTSPINLILVLLIIFLLVKLLRLRRKPEEFSSSVKRPPELPKMPKQDLTVEQLRKYNGVDSEGRILTTIYGDIFDVSRRSDLYGPGGSYSLFAGRDATRALSKMQLTQSLFSDTYDDLADLTKDETSTARSWHEDFRDKYDIVGRLLKADEKPSVYPSEESTVDGDTNTENKKTEQTATISSSFSYSIVRKNRMFQVRRTFLLMIIFDPIFMLLLWIIYNQILNITVYEAFSIEVIHYSIRTSLFDVVGLSAIRCLILIIPYAVLKWSHWIFITVSTLGSTGFIIGKTCLITINKSNNNITHYIILIVSFILAWIEIWFFDYRVIPHERRLREALNQGERQLLINAYEIDSTSPTCLLSNYHSVTIGDERHQSFYSFIYSLDGSDTNEIQNEASRTTDPNENETQSTLETPISSSDDDDDDDITQKEEYEKQANEIIDEIWKIFKDETGWNDESKSKDGCDIVVSKTYPKWGKVFRLTGTVTGPRPVIVKMLFERQEDFPKWSSSVIDCQVLQVIHDNLYITYQLTGEQAQGLIAKRDFVNLTIRRFIDDVTVLAAQACLHSEMPPKENCVRAENGPTAYIVEEIDETTCKFTWILNASLKGWIPQYIINAALAGVQLDLVQSLRNYITKTIDATSSCSSSTDDNTA